MSEIKPAMTPEEWATWTEADAGGPDPCNDHRRDWEQDRGGALHATAALALHKQPFGFTREDAMLLRDLLRIIKLEAEMGPEGLEVHTQPAIDHLKSLIERIEALLPPDDAKP